MTKARFSRSLFVLSALAALACSYSVHGADDVPYGVAKARWPEALGNHRAQVEVKEKADAVQVDIPWRRRDSEPEKKDVAIMSAAANREVKNRRVVSIDRERGRLVFQPDAGPGEYHVYYLPYSEDKVAWKYATKYAPPRQTADPAWLAANGLTPEGLAQGKWQSLPEARVVEFQTWSEFHRFDPMEVIATAAETKDLVEKHAGRSYLLFPEDRARPIRMTDDLPLCWIRRGPGEEFHGEARPGAFYVFQVGLFAARRPIEDLAVEISDLACGQGKPIAASEVRAFNLRGVDWLGRPFTKTFAVGQGKVGALWFGVPIPKDAPAGGVYQGTLTLRPKGDEPSTVKISLSISGDALEDGGVGDLRRLARLVWLDSTIGLDDEVVAPYTPLVVEGAMVACLGRSVAMDATGLPRSVRSGSREVLAAPMAIVAESAEGPAGWTGGQPRLEQIGPGTVVCTAQSSGGPLRMTTETRIEFDGYLNVRATLAAQQTVELKDVRLEIPVRRDVAAYMMGFGQKGGYRPKAPWKWTWDVGRANNMVWLGDVDAGLQCKLKGPKDTWDIYDLSAGGLPDSWHNGGRGGAVVAEEREAVVIRAYSGPRSLKAGQQVEFRFGLLVTPVKPLDPAHWNWRYYHYYAPVVPVEKIAPTGANIINCHQGNDLNPYINYPFLTAEPFAAYVREAHAKGLKVKTYYTVRELSNYTAELWPLRSLGFEVFLDGAGGGHSWLREHLVDRYGAAWHQPYPNGEVDAAIVTAGLSRWHNYYLEGLSWMIRNTGLDGLYLDGIGYDRQIMKRVRKVMDRARPGCLIDFHSGNEFGFNGLRISPANKYMEHFPYINSLWFGEGYDYQSEPPDYWLVEISGIPFGLYGEMLQGGGNPWRGMIYGMTARLGWGGEPRPVWKLWDEFGIRDARMIGYWDESCPVKTDRPNVLATAYVKQGKTLVSLASWAPETVECRLSIDWKALGLDPQKAHLFAPAIESFQRAALFSPDDPIPVYPARGWLLVIDQQQHDVPHAITTDPTKGRAVLLEDRFPGDALGKEWKTSLSDKPGTTLKVVHGDCPDFRGARRENGTVPLRPDGVISIEAPANCFAFAERPLPPGVGIVQCAVFSGTDKGATWGPGMAVLWPKGVIRVNLRAEGRFGVDDGANFTFGGFVGPNADSHLRVRLEEKEVFVEVSGDGRWWETLQTYPRGRYPGDPAAIRLGKSGPGGRSEDFSLPGPVGSCRVKDLRVYGKQAATGP
jgi:hypothetical protein